MNEQAWMKEPWVIIEHPKRGIDGMVQIAFYDGDDDVKLLLTDEMYPHDGRRIVACVNSLAGIADPAAAIKAARVAMKAVLAGFDVARAERIHEYRLQGYGGNDIPKITFDGEPEARAAIALLNGGTQ